MNIIQELLAQSQGVRTGVKMGNVEGLVWHWIGVCQADARRVRSSFIGTKLGTQYISDYNTGYILQVMPEDEMANHVGANKYTDTKLAMLGDKSPNRYLVGVECCIGDKVIPADWATPGKHMELGRPSDKQYQAMVEFSADFLTRHGLEVDRLFRHYDITGKLCHIWFCKDETRWIKFKADVMAAMKGEPEMDKESICAMVREEVEKALAERDNAVAHSVQKESPWATKSWDKAVKTGVFDGTRPGGNLTREQAAVVLDRLKLI